MYYLICALIAVMLKVMAVLRAVLKMPKRWFGTDITKPTYDYGKMLKYREKL